jgi:hypothetical protein
MELLLLSLTICLGGQEVDVLLLWLQIPKAISMMKLVSMMQS